EAQEDPAAGTAPTGRGDDGEARDLGVRETVPLGVVRRSATTRRPRPNARDQPGDPSPRRALVEPRRPAAPGDADGTQTNSRGVQYHRCVRYPRPMGRDDAGHAYRRPQ